MQTFQLEGEFISMVQLLKVLNWVEHGGMAQRMVAEGMVLYNGEVDYRKRLKVRKGDIVEFDNMKVQIV